MYWNAGTYAGLRATNVGSAGKPLMGLKRFRSERHRILLRKLAYRSPKPTLLCPMTCVAGPIRIG